MVYLYGCFPNCRGIPKWMVKIMEHPIKMDDLGGKPTIFGNIRHIPTFYHKNQPNVGRYTIHGSYGEELLYLCCFFLIKTYTCFFCHGYTTDVDILVWLK